MDFRNSLNSDSLNIQAALTGQQSVKLKMSHITQQALENGNQDYVALYP
jgi:hypothetical protein